MPVEREFKYVLKDPDKVLFDLLKKRVKWDQKILTQSYLSDSVRLRKVGTDSNMGSSDNYYFTYKKMVDGELIEIETQIDKYDYDKLFSTVEPGRTLTKTRFEWIESDYVAWSVDYLWDMKALKTYFIICEFETKYDIRTAPEPLYFLKDFVVHTDDGTYDLTSNALSDVDFAKEVMKEVMGL